LRTDQEAEQPPADHPTDAKQKDRPKAASLHVDRVDDRSGGANRGWMVAPAVGHGALASPTYPDSHWALPSFVSDAEKACQRERHSWRTYRGL